MLALLAATGMLVVAAAVGLVLIAVSALHPAAASRTAAAPTVPAVAASVTGSAPAGASVSEAGSTAPAADQGDERDVVAAASMPAVDPEAARPGAVSLTPPGELAVPAPSGVGRAGVPAGFPHTPAGALAELAAIDVAAFESGSLAGARAVLAGWAAPGGPTAQSWSLIGGLAVLLDQAGLSGGGSPRLALVLTPLMGLIKGTVGPDFVVPCVDFELDVTLDQTARGAVADCQRMVWTADSTGAGRWVIGPGPEPAAAPSVWPDTDTAISVGYRDLRTATHG